jgi:hypothetical protein
MDIKDRRRNMSRPLALILVAAALAGGLLASVVTVAPAVAGTSNAAPQIVAHPDSIMVNGQTRLIGSHFAPSTTITIKECSQQNWIAPRNPCDTTNSIKVTTNPKGHFKGVLTVHTCPGSATPGFSQTCYVGEPKGNGVDTVTLVGAVAITVTGP